MGLQLLLYWKSWNTVLPYYKSFAFQEGKYNVSTWSLVDLELKGPKSEILQPNFVAATQENKKVKLIVYKIISYKIIIIISCWSGKLWWGLELLRAQRIIFQIGPAQFLITAITLMRRAHLQLWCKLKFACIKLNQAQKDCIFSLRALWGRLRIYYPPPLTVWMQSKKYWFQLRVSICRRLARGLRCMRSCFCLTFYKSLEIFP